MRFGLDIALLGTLIAAYRPDWTGVALHQWLSMAIIMPLLVHGVVNWEWTARAVRALFARLQSASWIDLMVDGVLFLSAVGAMVSGFMVSPGLLAPIGVHFTAALAWHDIHAWSADATITLLALHAVMHWRWLFKMTWALLGISARRRGASAVPAAAASTVSPDVESEVTTTLRPAVALGLPQHASAAAPPDAFTDLDRSEHSERVRSARGRTSHRGRRATQVARERAIALRTISVIGVTAVAGLAVFAGVGMASPSQPGSPQTGVKVAEANAMTCPSTGCTAPRCHADYSQSADVFYAKSQNANEVHPKVESAKHPSPAASASARERTKRRAAAAAKPKAAMLTAKSKAKPKTAPKAKTKSVSSKTSATRMPTARVMKCPKTGCTASSCHGTHHVSASTYYKSH